VESLGEKLKSARESKGYTYDQISWEINIAGRYLEALEMEDFSLFPGEAYVLGFLRNYSEYLGLNGEELISLYRALKIQEQPVPVEQLLKNPANIPRIILIILAVLVFLGAAGGGIYFYLRIPKAEIGTETAPREPAVYPLSGTAMERRFYRGDAALIPLEAAQYRLELTGIGETLMITAPEGQVRLTMNQEANVDLTGDGIGDIRLTVVDFAENEIANGALLRIELNDDVSAPEEVPVEVPAAAAPPQRSPEARSPETRSPSSAMTVIFSSPNPYPFTLQAAFQGYCMFRWEIIAEQDRRGRNEQYFQRTDELNIQAQNGIRLWVSNAGAVKFQVSGGGRTVPLEMGGAGVVVVADLRWVRDDDGRFRLVLNRLD
jgi:cytoskeletal protein RodZ